MVVTLLLGLLLLLCALVLGVLVKALYDIHCELHQRIASLIQLTINLRVQMDTLTHAVRELQRMQKVG